MYEHYSVTVDKGQNLLRIDKFLTNRMEGASRNRIQTAADAGNILVNGVPVKSSYKVKPLDRVSIVSPIRCGKWRSFLKTYRWTSVTKTTT